MSNQKRFFLTCPHSGELVPSEVFWLQDQAESILMFDVDRYVDQLYEDTAKKLNLPFIKTKWHRYFSDANRFPQDVDAGSVKGSTNPIGKFPTGLIWQKTSQGHVLLDKPIEASLHKLLVEKYYMDFHNQVTARYAHYFKESVDPVFQLDLHSMPSMGTEIHRDPGQKRAEIVISDQNGKSAKKEYAQLVIKAYQTAGFDVAINWPYIGGRVTETYGQPEKNQHCVQVELRRDLYMDEVTKLKRLDLFLNLKEKLARAITYVFEHIDQI